MKEKDTVLQTLQKHFFIYFLGCCLDFSILEKTKKNDFCIEYFESIC
jgi:hypothetical protein